MREPGRFVRDVGEGERLVAAIGVRQDDGRTVAVDVAVDALVGDVELLAVAVEELPQLGGRIVLKRVRVGGVLGQPGHRSAVQEKVLRTMRRATRVVK